MAACNLLLAALTLCLACSLVRAQGLRFGSCPNPPSQTNFDLTRFLGVWYEQMNYFTPYELFQECITATYSLNLDNSVQIVNNGRLIDLRIPIRIVGRADQSPSDPARFQVNFGDEALTAPEQVQPNFQVLETDYNSYAVVFNCKNRILGLFNQQELWILTRARAGLSQAQLNPIMARLRGQGIDPDRLHPTLQVNCD